MPDRFALAALMDTDTLVVFERQALRRGVGTWTIYRSYYKGNLNIPDILFFVDRFPHFRWRVREFKRVTE